MIHIFYLLSHNFVFYCFDLFGVRLALFFRLHLIDFRACISVHLIARAASASQIKSGLFLNWCVPISKGFCTNTKEINYFSSNVYLWCACGYFRKTRAAKTRSNCLERNLKIFGLSIGYVYIPKCNCATNHAQTTKIPSSNCIKYILCTRAFRIRLKSCVFIFAPLLRHMTLADNGWTRRLWNRCQNKFFLFLCIMMMYVKKVC